MHSLLVPLAEEELPQAFKQLTKNNSLLEIQIKLVLKLLNMLLLWRGIKLDLYTDSF